MQLICISRGVYGRGKEVAEKIASKLGYICISREEVIEQATEYGIPVGKLEIAVLKNRPFSAPLAIQMELFKAFVSARLCTLTLSNEGVVYHGRAGHLVLPGLTQVLRVRVIADREFRLNKAMERMNLNREQARSYVEQVDEDIRRWVRTFYNEDWEDISLYHLTINAAHISVENAATGLLDFPSLPEFQTTPAFRKALLDRLLASRCRLAIGMDRRTEHMKVGVQAERGHVSITYLPRDSNTYTSIPQVIEHIEGVNSVVCTVASSNIMFLAERFDPTLEVFDHLVEISEKWNAAIELVRVDPNAASASISTTMPNPATPHDSREKGGILDDDDDDPPLPCGDDDCGLAITRHKLIQVGRAGGTRNITSDPESITAALTPRENYSLVVVGEVFGNKGAAKQRLKRDLVSLLSDRFAGPVIGTEDLKARYLFGPRQVLNLLAFAVLSVMLYSLVFHFQEPILQFISTGQREEGAIPRVLAALAVAVSVPFVAVLVGGFYSNLLKLVKLE